VEQEKLKIFLIYLFILSLSLLDLTISDYCDCTLSTH
jgi:hypothetical protein